MPSLSVLVNRPAATSRQRNEYRDRFVASWVVACTAAELIGIGVAGGVAALLERTIGGPTTFGVQLITLFAFACVGAVEGAALGVFQWWVLRRRLPRLRLGEWAGITMAVAVIGWLAGMAGPVLTQAEHQPPNVAASEPSLLLIVASAAAIGAGAGAIFGGAQWFVLRRHAQRAGSWIAIHVAGWGAAMAAIFTGASLPEPGWSAIAIVLCGAAGGAVGGVLLGVITGLVARRLEPWVDERTWSLAGKVCAVTGATSGIGREVALGLARMHASVVLLCRDATRGAITREAIRTALPDADVHIVACELESLASVRAAARVLLQQWPRLDVLVHSAGATFAARTLTADGIERTFAVDVAGPFLLTVLLRERLERSRGRVVTLAGIYHRKGHLDLDDLNYARRPYSRFAANNQAQLGRVFLTRELARRAPGLTTVAVHPGAVRTAAQAELPPAVHLLIATLLRPGFVRAELGALPVLRLATEPDLAGSGSFFNRFQLAPERVDARLAEKLWSACEVMSGLTSPATAAQYSETNRSPNTAPPRAISPNS